MGLPLRHWRHHRCLALWCQWLWGHLLHPGLGRWRHLWRALQIAELIVGLIAGLVGCCCGCCDPPGHRRPGYRWCPGRCRQTRRRRERGHQLSQNQGGDWQLHRHSYWGYRQFLRPPAPGGHRGRLAAGGWRLGGWPGKPQSGPWVRGWHRN